MSENNLEEKEIIEEQNNDENIIERNSNEVPETEAAIAEEVETKSETEQVQEETGSSKPSFLKRVGAAIVDEICIASITIILLYTFEALLILSGYFISQKVNMLFIIFILVSMLYTSIMEAMKNGKTLGKIIFNL